MKKIKLTRGKETIVDDFLYKELNKYKWCVDGRGYAQRRVNNKGITMHQFIWETLGINLEEGLMTDHINRDKLDNRISNLRIVSSRQNVINRGINKNNSSGYKGVVKHSQVDKWTAQIMVNRKSIYLGLFNTRKEAALAYNKVARKYFGEFAFLNDI